MPSSVSIIVPAFNEETNLASTVNEIIAAIGPLNIEYEILIIDDGSTDSTPQVASTISTELPCIRYLRTEYNRGLGHAFQSGLILACKEYVTMVPGDNSFDQHSLRSLFARIGAADIISGFTSNQQVRTTSRRVASKAYTTLLNYLFDLNLSYFNGPCIFKTQHALQEPYTTSGFAYMSVLTVRLLKSGKSIFEVPLSLQLHSNKRSRALRIRNLYSVLITVTLLFVELRIGVKLFHAPNKLIPT